MGSVFYRRHAYLMFLHLLGASAAGSSIPAMEGTAGTALTAVAVSKCWDHEYSFAQCCFDYFASFERNCWFDEYTYEHCCLEGPLLSDLDVLYFNATLDCGCDERVGPQEVKSKIMTPSRNAWHRDLGSVMDGGGEWKDGGSDSYFDDDGAQLFWCTVRNTLRTRETFLGSSKAQRGFGYLTTRQMAKCPFGVLSILAYKSNTVTIAIREAGNHVEDDAPMNDPAFRWVREWFAKSQRPMLQVALSGDWYIFTPLVMLKFLLSRSWDRGACAGVGAEPQDECGMVGNAADMTRTVMGYVNGGDDLRYSFGDTDRAPKFDAVTIPLNCPYAIAVHALLGVLAVRWRAWGSTLKTQAQDMEAMAIGAAELVLKTTTKSDIMPVMCSRWPLLELVDVMRFYPQVEYYSDSELAHRRINDGVLPNSAHNYSDDKRNSNRQLFHADKVARAIEYRTTTFVRHAERRLRNFVDEKWNAFDLLGPVFPLCPEADLQVYGTGDEERRICDITKLADGNPCIVVAIGSNGQWGFEEATYDRTDCIIHVFDCYGNFTPPPRIRDRVFSHRLCVSGKRRETNNPRFARYHELLRRANVTTQVTFLKMDIDGAEFFDIWSLCHTTVAAKTADKIFSRDPFCSRVR
eukprot:GEMP01018910.1.p1 GENE.GEMP01018910.1~~GEMP01018910.1.p1  ORF type:complete len:646 (-),score=101.35 GEMP01018910.1:781-2679(-)